jgi:hypothetical protein
MSHQEKTVLDEAPTTEDMAEESEGTAKIDSSVSAAVAPTAISSPFLIMLDDIMVEHVFEFVGADHYRYLAGINAKFPLIYNRFLQRKSHQR